MSVKFELIQIIGRHNGPAWAIGISSEGGIVVSGGKDRSLRFFRRTEEQVLRINIVLFFAKNPLVVS